MRLVLLRALETEALEGPLIPTTVALLDYLHAEMAFAPVEQVRALFLDARNRLIRDELVSTGTVSESALYVRELIRRALDVNATGLILVHNHPSGDVEPSKSDIVLTRNVVRGLREIGVVLHDHLIIASSGWQSMRALALI